MLPARLLMAGFFLAWREEPGGPRLLGSHWIHEVGLTLAMALGAFALGRGNLEHGFVLPSAVGGMGLGVMAGSLTLPHDGTEAVATMLGVMILALGHDLNRRAVI